MPALTFSAQKRKRGSWESANAFFRLLRYHAAELRQNRHRRRRLAVRRAFAPMLIYQPDSGMLAVSSASLKKATC